MRTPSHSQQFNYCVQKIFHIPSGKLFWSSVTFKRYCGHTWPLTSNWLYTCTVRRSSGCLRGVLCCICNWTISGSGDLVCNYISIFFLKPNQDFHRKGPASNSTTPSEMSTDLKSAEKRTTSDNAWTTSSWRGQAQHLTELFHRCFFCVRFQDPVYIFKKT